MFEFVHNKQAYVGSFSLDRYSKNGNLSVRLLSKSDDGTYWENYSSISINTDKSLPPDQFVAKLYSENYGLVDQFIEQGYFEKTGQDHFVSQYVGEMPILRLTDKARQFVME